MTSPVQTLVDSELRRLGPQRGMIQLQAGLLFVQVLMTAVLAAAASRGVVARSPAGAAGQSFAGAVLLVQAGFLIWGTALLAFEESGIVQREILQLVRITGLTARQWLAVRVGSLVPLLLSIGLLPLPFLVLASFLGGVSWTGIAAAEAVIACHLAMLLCLALFQSTRLDGKGGALSLFGFECLAEMFIPAVASVLRLLDDGPLTQGLGAVAAVLSRSKGSQSILDALRGTLTPGQFALACAVPLGMAWLLGRIVVNRLYVPTDEQSLPDPTALAEIAEEPAPEPAERKEPDVPVSGPVSRLSERCWDDALAWHAVFFLSAPTGTRAAKNIVIGKSMIYALVIVGVLLVEILGQPPWQGIATVIAGALIGLLVLAGVAYPATSFGRELEDRMMELQLLTPHDGVDFYDGWSRGARRMQLPEYAAAFGIIGMLLATYGQVVGAAATAVLAGLLNLGPVLAYGSLLQSGFLGSLGVMWLLALVGLTVFCAGVVGVWLNPWASVPVVGILIWSFGRLCRQGIDGRLRVEYEARDQREP